MISLVRPKNADMVTSVRPGGYGIFFAAARATTLARMSAALPGIACMGAAVRGIAASSFPRRPRIVTIRPTISPQISLISPGSGLKRYLLGSRRHCMTASATTQSGYSPTSSSQLSAIGVRLNKRRKSPTGFLLTYCLCYGFAGFQPPNFSPLRRPYFWRRPSPEMSALPFGKLNWKI